MKNNHFTPEPTPEDELLKHLKVYLALLIIMASIGYLTLKVIDMVNEPAPHSKRANPPYNYPNH